MSEKVQGSDGKTYERQSDGTLTPVSSSSVGGGILGALVDSAESLVRTAVDVVTPSTSSGKK